MAYEIDKLRTRLKNVKKGITELYLTVDEAKRLLQEIESIEDRVATEKVTEKEVRPVTRKVIDGGTF